MTRYLSLTHLLRILFLDHDLLLIYDSLAAHSILSSDIMEVPSFYCSPN